MEVDLSPPNIAGTWEESLGVFFEVTQQGRRFTATTEYRHPEFGQIRAVLEGMIMKDGKIIANLEHTKAPADWESQRREAVLSADQKTISGHAIVEGGGRQEFEWKKRG